MAARKQASRKRSPAPARGEQEGGSGPGTGQDAGAPPASPQDNIQLLGDVPLTMSIELGRTRRSLDDVHGIGEQSLIEFDKQAGDPVDILLNGKLFARGEVVTVSESFGVRITEIVGQV